jgi:DNA-binding GntR family transcriptional regulator
MIVEAGLPPGHRMSHRSLSKQLGIGRSPVRDAVLKLEAEGLLVQRAQQGVLLRELSPKELGEIYDLRLVMEPFFAERAALYRDVSQVTAIRRTVDEMSKVAERSDILEWFGDAANRRRIVKLDLCFHTLVVEAANNAIAYKAFSSAQVLSLTFAWYAGHGTTQTFAKGMVKTATEHQAIAAAIRDRDPIAAREAMRQHVTDALLVVPERYAAIVQSEEEAAERASTKRAAAAVR